jgi:hypothetical protein
MPGPEEYLGAYMLALADQGAGRESALSRLDLTMTGRKRGESFADFWRRQPHHFPQEVGAPFRGGSVNIGCMLWAVGLWHPQTREQAIREALWWFDANRRMGFELSEPGARVRDYRTWTLLAHPLAWRWCTTMAEANRAGSVMVLAPEIIDSLAGEIVDWLAFFWAKYALCMVMTPDGPMCIEGGARSQGAGLYRLKYDYAASIAFGLPWLWRAKPQRRAKGSAPAEDVLTDKFWAKDWEIQAADALREEIEASAYPCRTLAADVLSGELRSLPGFGPKYPTLISEQHIVRYQDGSLVVWNGDGTDNDAVPGGNTAGLGAVGWEGLLNPDTGANAMMGQDWPDRMWSLPPGGGVRIRQKTVSETCWAEDVNGSRMGEPGAGRPRELVYRQQIEDGAITIASHPLPDSPIVYHVKHGRNGLVVVA